MLLCLKNTNLNVHALRFYSQSYLFEIIAKSKKHHLWNFVYFVSNCCCCILIGWIQYIYLYHELLRNRVCVCVCFAINSNVIYLSLIIVTFMLDFPRIPYNLSIIDQLYSEAVLQICSSEQILFRSLIAQYPTYFIYIVYPAQQRTDIQFSLCSCAVCVGRKYIHN